MKYKEDNEACHNIYILDFVIMETIENQVPMLPLERVISMSFKII